MLLTLTVQSNGIFGLVLRMRILKKLYLSVSPQQSLKSASSVRDKLNLCSGQGMTNSGITFPILHLLHSAACSCFAL